jgi:segregation and condensation protein B
MVERKAIIEAALMAAGRPLTLKDLQRLFAEDPAPPDAAALRADLEALAAECEGRGYELVEVASGWRYQVRRELGHWVLRLWDEKPTRLSRALLETLALIVYRQPITRAEIEQVRGVSVSSNIIRTLEELEWIRVVGHKEAPGRPALYASTRRFLDDFNLKSLADLPSLAEFTEEAEVVQLPLPEVRGDAERP